MNIKQLREFCFKYAYALLVLSVLIAGFGFFKLMGNTSQYVEVHQVATSAYDSARSLHEINQINETLEGQKEILNREKAGYWLIALSAFVPWIIVRWAVK